MNFEAFENNLQLNKSVNVHEQAISQKVEWVDALKYVHRISQYGEVKDGINISSEDFTATKFTIVTFDLDRLNTSRILRKFQNPVHVNTTTAYDNTFGKKPEDLSEYISQSKY